MPLIAVSKSTSKYAPNGTYTIRLISVEVGAHSLAKLEHLR